MKFTKAVSRGTMLVSRSAKRYLCMLVLFSGIACANGIGQSTPVQSSDYLTILTAFRQAKGPNAVVKNGRDYGNCDSIALIKTAMATFGRDGVFTAPKSLPRSNSEASYEVTLRNGHQLTISHQELDMAINNLDFNSGLVLPDGEASGDKDILFGANFVYAVMAKEMTFHRDMAIYSNVLSFQDALKRMGSGINVEGFDRKQGRVVNQIDVLLGVTLKDISQENGVPLAPYVYALRKHVVFAFDEVGDNFGKKGSFSDILDAHSTSITRTWGQNKFPKKYAIVTP